MKNHNGPILWLISMISGLIFLAGCQHFDLSADMRHECPCYGAIDRESGEKFDPARIKRPSPAPIVKIIEFTDDGELHDRCQVTDLLYEIRGGPELDAVAKERAKFMVIYVHGWKHNASKYDPDLRLFTSWIKHLSERSGTKTDVVGIYVSWPGKSIDVPVIDNLSFWGRKGAADRVSAGAYVSKLLSTIESIRRQRGNPNDFTVGIGHSFGARILYSAVSPLLLHELQTHHPGVIDGVYERFTGVLDLTVLLNPAFEATRYTALDSSRRKQEKFDKNQQPLLLSISTTNDLATRIAFPVGQFLGTRFKDRETTALGNYDSYITHRLELSPLSDSSNGAWYDHFCRSGICLTRSAKDVQPGNPFLVAKTGPEVIDGHNEIWKPELQSWLMEFILKIKQRRTIESAR